jgi:ubiquinone/menaquinone biosynthesis C-methylase UbiE
VKEYEIGYTVRKILPKPVKSLIKWVCCSIVDVWDYLLGRRDYLTPPKRLIFIGDGDFRKTGEEFFNYFVRLAKLQPHEKVLDVGCGIGRMAVPLTRYLQMGKGSYAGFDIVDKGIQWCNENISNRYSNFKFQLADVYNKAYNPRGTFKVSRYRFPYDNNSFDFVFLTSVFTHMLPLDMEHYLSEISRVLKSDGRCLITFFLINPESLEYITSKVSLLDFRYECKDYRTTNKDNPETAVAFSEIIIRRLFELYSLNIIEPIHYGSWCGREEFLSYQDLVIATKRG